LGWLLTVAVGWRLSLLLLLRSILRCQSLLLILLRSIVGRLLLLHLRLCLILGGRRWRHAGTGRLTGGRWRRRRKPSPNCAATTGRGRRAGTIKVVFGIRGIRVMVVISRLAATSACIVIGKMGAVVPVRGPWTIVPVFTTVAVITITRSLTTIVLVVILDHCRSTTIAVTNVFVIALSNKQIR